MPVSTGFKVYNITFVVLFIIFAGLQYNDPDPYVWMPIYLLGAWICYQASKGQMNIRLYILGLSVYSLYAIYLLFDKTGVIDWASDHHAENIVQTMKAEKPWIEETREFGGLLILIVVFVINWMYLRRK
ncbi:transmembrane 220 family protein [Mucilaginibacter sp. KACC 22063]|uniref:transmembrane 220 family protein n=1 Tax=Mucilaginibacter sp. KACC 22063 TaxID=3025666 RepID=UPI0023662C50|nr:transmembrane 220 family protein [Mucilaginibacter sp. KACC 22063]WDF53484.1 transmembrane 220 family protein [Mucilaginibacter sp. KACC 22063]